LGTCVSVDAPEPVRTELRAVLTDLESASDPRRQLVVEEEGDFRFRLLDSGEMVREGIEPSVAAATVVWRLNAIAADTRRYLLIHAGCVADERAVLLPAAPEPGSRRSRPSASSPAWPISPTNTRRSTSRRV